MGRARHLFLLFLLVVAAACSSPEDRAFAMRFVDNVRSGNEQALKPDFNPELWAKSREQLPTARTLFPSGKGKTRLEGYHVFINVTNGASSTRKEYILLTADQAHWTRTRIVTFAEGGPAKVVEWNVEGFSAPPPEQAMIDAMASALPWVLAGLAIALLGLGGLIFWLVRRGRRRRAAMDGLGGH